MLSKPAGDAAAMVQSACENNNVYLLDEAIALGFDASTLGSVAPFDSSIEMLEGLLARGWNINYRTNIGHKGNALPFIWHQARDLDRIKWCLANGASIIPTNRARLTEDERIADQGKYGELLERVASVGNIQTFDYLHALGAPLGYRPLHLAVERALLAALKKEMQPYEDAVATIKYLIDVVGLDVNARDAPRKLLFVGYIGGTPLQYNELERDPDLDARELVTLLLDRGADPAAAMDYTNRSGDSNPEFAIIVRDWQARLAPKVSQ